MRRGAIHVVGFASADSADVRRLALHFYSHSIPLHSPSRCLSGQNIEAFKSDPGEEFAYFFAQHPIFI